MSVFSAILSRISPISACMRTKASASRSIFSERDILPAFFIPIWYHLSFFRVRAFGPTGYTIERSFWFHGFIGRRIRLIQPEQSDGWRTVVGVVGDLYYQGAAAEAQPTIYTPFAQTPFLWSYVMVRTTGEPGAVIAAVRSAVPAAVPRSTAANIRPMRDVLTESVAEPRLTVLLTGAFGLLALLLAGIGIYGVISYTVAQRTREIGIRRVLGARVIDVIGLVVGEGLVLGVTGIAFGLASAAVIMTWISALLFGVTAHDPVTYAGVGMILLAIAGFASWVPARRAIRVEPVAALRHE